MRARAALSILLLAVMIVAPVVMHARSRDPAAALVGFDFDPDMPAVVDDAAPVVAVIQPYLIVDLAEAAVATPPRVTAVLAMAPKTSPPFV
jgi:hypothetical protein